MPKCGAVTGFSQPRILGAMRAAGAVGGCMNRYTVRVRETLVVAHEDWSEACREAKLAGTIGE